MKQVIFLCLLSLTLCLAKPADPAPANNGTTVDPKAIKTTIAPLVPAATALNQTTQANGTAAQLAANNTTQPTHVEEQKPTTSPTDNKTVTKDEKPAPSPTSTPAPAPTTKASHNETADVKPATQNTTKPEEKGTAKNDTASTTVPPNHDVPAKPIEPKSDDVKHLVQARGFDGPSFMGGIILTLGLLAIGFMGFKYYKNQTERNYHTL